MLYKILCKRFLGSNRRWGSTGLKATNDLHHNHSYRCVTNFHLILFCKVLLMCISTIFTTVVDTIWKYWLIIIRIPMTAYHCAGKDYFHAEIGNKFISDSFMRHMTIYKIYILIFFLFWSIQLYKIPHNRMHVLRRDSWRLAKTCNKGVPSVTLSIAKDAKDPQIDIN